MTRAVGAVAAIVTGAVLSLAVASVALAADPSASPIAGDPRSSGEGPGLVGEPLTAFVAVVAIALVAVLVTTAWVRLTAGRDRTRSGPS